MSDHNNAENEPQSWFEKIPSENYPKIAISAVAVFVVVIDSFSSEITIEWPHIVLLVVAMLPWAHGFLDSLDISSKGVKAEFKKLEDKVDTIVEANSEPEISAIDAQIQTNTLSEDEVRILKALTNTNYALRSVSGIRKSAKLADKVNVKLMLRGMRDDDLVRSATGKEGNELWAVSGFGRNTLEGHKK